MKTKGNNLESLNFEAIEIYGLDKNANEVSINSNPTKNFTFDSDNKVTIIKLVL